MVCPVCRATMHNVGASTDRIFWCPRCGTIKTESGSGPEYFEEHEMPRLVERVRDANTMAFRISLDELTLHFAVPLKHWLDVCEAVGLDARAIRDEAERVMKWMQRTGRPGAPP